MRRLLPLFPLLLLCLAAPQKVSGAVIRVGVYENPPLVSTAQGMENRGLGVDLMEYVAQQEGLELDYVAGSWEECLTSLKRGEIDALIAVAFSPERARDILFSEATIISNWGQVYVPRGSNVDTLSSLHSRTVAVLRGDIFAENFLQTLAGLQIDATLVQADDYETLLAMVHGREVDAGLVNRLYGLAQEKNHDLRRTSIILNPVEVRFAFARGKEALAAVVDRHLAVLTADPDSYYYRAMEQYLGGGEGRSLPDWVKWMTVSGLGVLLVSLGVTLILRTQVRSKTAQLSARNETLLREAADRALAEGALRETQERYRLLVENVDLGITLIGTDRRILMANGAMGRLFKKPSRDLVSRLCYEEFQKVGAVCEHCPGTRAMESGEPTFAETQGVRDDGTTFPALVKAFPVIHPGGGVGGFIEVVEDITERKASEARIEQLAYFDPLTALPNRTLLADRLSQFLEQGRRDQRQVAVLVLDLDRFKGINETLGHSLGDRFLKTVADRLTGSVRRSDTVARLGGDEFAIVLNALIQGEVVSRIAQKILTNLSAPFHLDGEEIFGTASIGIALFPQDGEEAGTLLKNAETALHAAKERGRDNYQFFSREMNKRAVERLVLETKLRRALEREELFLHYQPQVDALSGRIIGAEALLRWQQPDIGMVSPGRFIPLAEETGLIGPIGAWVLQEACSRNRQWQNQGLPPVRMAVNISGRQFARPNLAREVAEVLERTGLSPEYLELELTESILMENAENARQTLCALKELGVQLAIDDFGTGYSSLNYLKHFPIDRIKIDQSFVRDISADPDDAAIVEAVIAIARSLGKEVIAEGVETREQMDFLHARRCTEMQGYYFARPLPESDLARCLSGGLGALAPSESPAG